MRAWITVYGLFARVIGKWAIIGVFSSTLIVLTIDKLFPTKMLAGLPGLGTATLILISMLILLPRNFSWLMGVPISKRQIILLLGAVNFTLAIVGVLCHFLIIGLVSYFINGDLAHLRITFAVWQNFFHNVGHFAPFQGADPQAYAMLVSIVMFFGLVFFAPITGNNRQQLSFKRLPTADWIKANPLAVLRIVAIPLFMYITRSYFLSPFGIFILWIFGLCVVVPASWVSQIALTGRAAKTSYILFLIFAFLNIAVTYGLSRSAIRGNSEGKVKAILFLGQFAGHANQKELASLLETDMGVRTGNQLGNQYLVEFNEGEKLERGVEKVIDFEKLINSRKTIPAIQSAYELYDPETLTLNDLRTVFRAFKKLGYQDDARAYFPFLEAEVSPAQMIGLFGSEDKMENAYALLRARYDRDPAYTKPILGNLPRYSEKTLLVALDTLSILRSSRVTLEDWRMIRNGRSLAAVKEEANCAKLHVDSLSGLKPSDAGLFNICLRQKANKFDSDLISAIEHVGWFEIPLSAAGIWTANKVFHPQE